MSNILINGLNAKTGGGKSILNNYLTLLRNSNSKHRYYILTPDKREYERYSCEFIRIVEIARVFRSNFLFPLLYLVALPRLMRAHKIDIIFNLGDIPIPSDIPQVYLFDWSYAVYPDSVVWKRMDARSYLKRRIKLFVFKRYLKYATTVIAQTKTMKAHLETHYRLNNVEVLPPAVSLEKLAGRGSFDFDLPKDKIKFLYLTYYYSHKNLEVFLPLARKIKEMSLSYCIVITIDSTQHSKAKEFLRKVNKEELDDVIVNIGPVSMDAVPSLYAQCDALLMPTLLETFGLPYLEAMFHNKTILTSDLDFAKDVCGQAAFYFDPLAPDSILSTMNHAFEDDGERMSRIEEGKKQLDKLLRCNRVFDKYQEILEKTISKEAQV